MIFYIIRKQGYIVKSQHLQFGLNSQNNSVLPLDTQITLSVLSPPPFSDRFLNPDPWSRDFGMYL